MESMTGDIPWRIGHGSEEFRLISLDDRCVGFKTSIKRNILTIKQNISGSRLG
jgi:hypothetical protein